MQLSLGEVVHSATPAVVGFEDWAVIYYLLYVSSKENRNYPCFKSQMLNLNQGAQLKVSAELQRFQKEVGLGLVGSEVTQSFRLFNW